MAGRIIDVNDVAFARCFQRFDVTFTELVAEQNNDAQKVFDALVFYFCSVCAAAKLPPAAVTQTVRETMAKLAKQGGAMPLIQKP